MNAFPAEAGNVFFQKLMQTQKNLIRRIQVFSAVYLSSSDTALFTTARITAAIRAVGNDAI